MKLGFGFKWMATGLIAAAVSVTTRAFAVDCPTAQILNGNSGFGKSVAMYIDGITGEYLIVSDSSNTWYWQKAPGSTATFGSPTLLAGELGTLAVGQNGTVMIGRSTGPAGVVDVFQQATNSSGIPQGSPFNFTGTIDLRNTINISDPTFGQSINYDWRTNVVVICGNTAGCLVLLQRGIRQQLDTAQRCQHGDPRHRRLTSVGHRLRDDGRRAVRRGIVHQCLRLPQLRRHVQLLAVLDAQSSGNRRSI